MLELRDILHCWPKGPPKSCSKSSPYPSTEQRPTSPVGCKKNWNVSLLLTRSMFRGGRTDGDIRWIPSYIRKSCKKTSHLWESWSNNDPEQTSRSTKAWIQMSWNTLEWASQSPGWNPVENPGNNWRPLSMRNGLRFLRNAARRLSVHHFCSRSLKQK